MRYARHVFVCTNTRPAAGKPSCGARGSADVCQALQRAAAAHPALCGRVAVTESGCLGPCFDGPNVVVYPEGVWYAGVTDSDVPAIVSEHLLAGRPVDRLVYRWPPDHDIEDDDDGDDTDGAVGEPRDRERPTS